MCGYVSKPYMVTRGQTKLGIARAKHVTKFTHLHMPNSLLMNYNENEDLLFKFEATCLKMIGTLVREIQV